MEINTKHFGDVGNIGVKEVCGSKGRQIDFQPVVCLFGILGCFGVFSPLPVGHTPKRIIGMGFEAPKKNQHIIRPYIKSILSYMVTDVASFRNLFHLVPLYSSFSWIQHCFSQQFLGLLQAVSWA